MIVRGNSTAEIKNLNINVTKSNREKNTSQSADSDAAYGLAVGYNWNGGSNTGNARVNVENANITVNNTADTVRGNILEFLFLVENLKLAINILVLEYIVQQVQHQNFILQEK
ncbi:MULTISPECIES: hypothetical protein [Haemophilus]|uniref:hypothetical protein n=1 Tax=Haemophilus TaxID=724 RepID=UPI0002F598E7|nr:MULTISPECIES: hypothetical protein [Haemophilus]